MGGPIGAWMIGILAQAVAVTVGDRTEARTRVDSGHVFIDADTRPSIQLDAWTPRTTFGLGYSPTVTALGINSPNAVVVVVHSAQAVAGYRFERTSFSLGENVTYGRENFRALSIASASQLGPTPAAGPGTMPPGQTGSPPDPTASGQGGQTPAPGATPLPQVQGVDETVVYGSSNTSARIQHAFSRRLGGAVTGSYQISGGLDARSRAAIPVQKGPGAGAGVRYIATLVDTVGLTVTGDAIRTEAPATALLPATTTEIRQIGAVVNWAHRWTGQLSGQLFGGAFYERTEQLDPPTEATNDVRPEIGASLNYLTGFQGGHLAVGISSTIAPVIDRFSGLVDERASWATVISWTRGRLTLLGTVAGVESLYAAETAPSFLSYAGSAGAIYRLTREWSVDGGVRASWQRSLGVGTLPILWGAFVGITYRSRIATW
jgi:hypothetical protein